MNNSPAGFGLAKQERESSVRLIIRAFEAPATQDQGRIFAQQVDFQVREREFAQFVTDLRRVDERLRELR